MSREDSQFKLRLPSDLRERVQAEAGRSNQSINALVVSVLELAFPQPSINLHELAAFLSGVASEAGQGDTKGYIGEVNRGLASAKQPWTMKIDGFDVISFYPYADAPEPSEI